MARAALAAAALGAVWPPVSARCQAPLAPGAATTYLSAARRGFDILRGQDKPGPYQLSWLGLRLTAEDTPVVVDIDGKDLTPDAYTLDAAKGTITFHDPLKSTSLARVEYDYDPVYSLPNPAAVASAAPILLPTAALGELGASLQMAALPTLTGSGTGSTAQDAARLVWSLGDKSRVAGGNLTSQLLFGDGAGRTSFEDRTGLNFGYGLGNAKSGFDAHFLRGGSGLTPGAGKAFGMADGKQDLGLNARAHPLNWLGWGYTTDDTRDLAGNGDASQRAITLHMGAPKPGAVALDVQSNGSRQFDGQGNGQTASDSKANFAARFAPTLAMTAKTEVTQTDATDPTKTGGDQETSIILDSKNARGNVSQATLALTDGLKTTNVDKEAHAGVSLKLQPASRVTVTVANIQNAVDPDAATVATVARTAVQQTSVAADVMPAPNTHVTGTVQQAVQEGGTTLMGSGSTAAEAIDAQVGLSKTVTVSGGVTNRDATQGGIAALDSTRVHFAVAPAPGVSVTTGMVVNPEQNGIVNEARQQDVGVTVKSGAWNLGSGYTVTTLSGAAASDPRGLPTQTGEMKVDLGLKVSKFAQLTWGYKNDFQCGNTNPTITAPPRGLEAYSLNYSHLLGTAFTLTVGGSVVDDRSNLSQPQDVEASAKLGVKF